MSKLPLDKGRVSQKLQTRQQILNAVKSLMKTKRKISLEDVAQKAKISRATIYRYFSNVELLVTEASLDIHHIAPIELAESTRGKDLVDSIKQIQSYYNNLAHQHENAFRRYLIAALQESVISKKKIRGARRVEALEHALNPFKKELSNKEFTNLVAISSVLSGIDALIVNKDVVGLSNEESQEALEWAIEMIILGIHSQQKA